MSATNLAAADILRLMFTAVDWGNVADNASIAPLTDLQISLHTGDPGETGNQSSSEATYTGYARVGVARSAAGWTVTEADPALVTNDAAITFPTATGGTNNLTHIGVGSAATGAGRLLLFGALTSPLAVSNGITPEFAINALNFTLD